MDARTPLSAEFFLAVPPWDMYESWLAGIGGYIFEDLKTMALTDTTMR